MIILKKHNDDGDEWYRWLISLLVRGIYLNSYEFMHTHINIHIHINTHSLPSISLLHTHTHSLSPFFLTHSHAHTHTRSLSFLSHSFTLTHTPPSFSLSHTHTLPSYSLSHRQFQADSNKWGDNKTDKRRWQSLSDLRQHVSYPSTQCCEVWVEV